MFPLTTIFQHDKFDEQYENTVGLDFYSKTITSDGNECRLQIWDTSGHESFHEILPSYLKKAHGIVVTFDVTDKASFDAVDTFVNMMKENDTSDIPRVLVGTKIDKSSERLVTFENA